LTTVEDVGPVTRRIRIFVSSPGDVADERRQCGEVVQELNLTLRALIPARDVELELVRWETHTHPDLTGNAQAVVDDQIDPDYDIFLGIMWSRFGTPTPTAGSGTEHEFRAAKRGWEEARHPTHLLFYFCEAPISAALAGQMADQLKSVYAFRTELSQQGLVGSYQDRDRFGDKVRRDLVLVLSRLLSAEAPPAQVADEAARSVTDAELAIVQEQVRTESEAYQSIRDTMSAGDQRTRRMEVVASRLRTLAQSVYPLIPELVASSHPGDHLAAVCALQAIPNATYLGWLGDRVCVEKPFVGYHATLALLEAARSLPVEQMGLVAAAAGRAEECSRRLRTDTDRAATLGYVRRELARRTR
jgi:Domain of unknown function (DUF4062)